MSGGPDSLALLLLAHAAFTGAVEAATVDHGLRAEAPGEAAMVAHICADLGVPHRILRVELAPGNMHDRARQARYRALGQWVAERGLGAVLTAHHADDQAETLLMRLNRGSGLAGLAGVRGRQSFALPGIGTVEILRPLLGWRRSELEVIVAAAGLTPVRDPSNDDERFDRARVRAFLAQQDWLDPSALAQSAHHLAEAEAALDSVADEVFAAQVRRTNGATVFTPGHPRPIEIAVVRRILRDLGAGAASTSAIAQMVDRLRAGRNASLGGVLARPEKGGEGWRFEAEPPRRSR